MLAPPSVLCDVDPITQGYCHHGSTCLLGFGRGLIESEQVRMIYDFGPTVVIFHINMSARKNPHVHTADGCTISSIETYNARPQFPLVYTCSLRTSG